MQFFKQILKKILFKNLRSFLEKNFRNYHSANNLDIKMLKYINFMNGFYIEVGANDGILQSNTLFYEKNKNWRGVLVEPIKKKFLDLKKNRNNKNFFFNNALVSFNYKKKKIKLIYSDLMTITKNVKTINVKKHLSEGNKHLNIFEKSKEFEVSVKTLNEILLFIKAPNLIDFFSLDTEGYEEEILKGINFKKFNFKFILVECINNFEKINCYLSKKNYKFLEKMSNVDYLFKYKKF